MGEAAPGGLFFFTAAGDGFGELADFGLLKPEGSANKIDAGGAFAADGGAAKRADHFVVAHINDPEIPIVADAFTGDGQDDVRIDRGHRHANDFELFVGIAIAEERFEVTAHAEGGFGIAERGGFAEEKNAECAGIFLNGHDDGRGTAGDAGREETEAEKRVLDVVFLALDGLFDEEVRSISVASEAQTNFEQTEQESGD